MRTSAQPLRAVAIHIQVTHLVPRPLSEIRQIQLRYSCYRMLQRSAIQRIQYTARCTPRPHLATCGHASPWRELDQPSVLGGWSMAWRRGVRTPHNTHHSPGTLMISSGLVYFHSKTPLSLGAHELRLSGKCPGVSATTKLIISALVLSLHLRPRDRLNGGIHPRHYQMAPTVNPESVDNWIESRADVPPQSSVLRGSVDRAGVCIAVHFNFLCRNVSSHQRIFLLSKKIMPSI